MRKLLIEIDLISLIYFTSCATNVTVIAIRFRHVEKLGSLGNDTIKKKIHATLRFLFQSLFS